MPDILFMVMTLTLLIFVMLADDVLNNRKKK